MRYVYFGHHKCATSWTRDILRKIHPGSYVSVSRDENHGDYGKNLGAFMHMDRSKLVAVANACYQHLGDMPEYKAFHVIRDPRDIVVSAYYSHRDLPGRPKTSAFLKSVSLEEGLIQTILDCRWEFECIYNWNYEDPNIAEYRFFEIVANPVSCFQLIFYEWGFSMDKRIKKIVEANSFERLTGRKRGEEKQGHSLRKGIAGDWRNHFTKACSELFLDLYDDILIKLDYEKDNGWI